MKITDFIIRTMEQYKSIKRFFITIMFIVIGVLCHAQKFDYSYKGVTFKCKVKSGCVEITSFDRDAYSVTIPGVVTYRGVNYNVTKVNTYISGDNYSAAYLTLEEGIREIANYCFIEFRQLQSVTLPSTITKVGGNSFANKEKIATFNAPENVKYLVFGWKSPKQTENERLLAEYEAKVRAEREYAEQLEKQRKAEEEAEKKRLEEEAEINRKLAKLEKERQEAEAKRERYLAEQAERERKRAAVVKKTDDVSDDANVVADNSDKGGRSKPKTQVAVTGADIVSDVDEVPNLNHTNENSFAVIIANETYQVESPVEYALRDGRTFKEYCKNILGIPDENIRMLENASMGQIKRTVENWLPKVANAYANDCRIYIYYAGHGMPDEENNCAYMLPTDAYADDLKGTAYKMSEMYALLGKLPAQSVTVFLDACFTGMRRDGQAILAARSVAVIPDEENLSGNVMVFTATSERETAYPYKDKGHGLFTYYLLKKLKETQGAVTYRELADYVTKWVSRKSLTLNDKGQTPTVNVSAKMQNKWKLLKFNAK